ncbi:zinc ribbon domain-containing protein [Demequina aurantiaca]|uniref:zinc ribbon domain-containing protein n=1 Tax=Demequina aurantiaca TaxID=676200 RepID=UPI003D3568CE
MPTAPAADQKRILVVQDADTRANQARHRRDHHPLISQIDELMGRALDLDEERIARGTEVSDLKREVTKAEDDVQAVRTRAARDNKRLESGQGTSKDLQALQSELEVLTRRQDVLEEVEMEIMQRLEDAQKAQSDSTEQYDAIMTQVEGLKAQQLIAFNEIEAELQTIAAEREKAVDGVDATLVALYEKIRAQYDGIGAAELIRGACQGCHMNLNAGELARINAAPSNEVVRCEECGRILVRGTGE